MNFLRAFTQQNKSEISAAFEQPLTHWQEHEIAQLRAIAKCMIKNAKDALLVRYRYLLNQGFQFDAPEIAFRIECDSAPKLTPFPGFYSLWKSQIPSVFFQQSVTQCFHTDSDFRGFRLLCPYQQDAFWAADKSTMIDMIAANTFVDLGSSPSVDEPLGFYPSDERFAPQLLRESSMPTLNWIEHFCERGSLKIHDSEQFVQAFSSVTDSAFLRGFIETFTSLPCDLWSPLYLDA